MTSTIQQEHRARGGVSEATVPPYRDGVTFGLFGVIAGAAGVMAAYGEVFVDALVFLLVFAGLGVWSARSASTRLRWAVAGLAAVFVAINLVYAIGDLSHPESPAPFIATSVVIVGGLVTAALAALAARRRPVRGRRVWSVTAALLVLASIGSLVAAAGVEDDVAEPGDVTIVAEDVEFPAQVAVDSAAGGILVRNADPVRHTIAVEGQVSVVELPASSSVRVPVDLGPGTYRYFCDVPGHEAMEGELIVG